MSRALLAVAAPALSINLNKVALVRNTRQMGIPSVSRAARLCLQAGAQGLTVHPRPDGRHIRSDDVRALYGLIAQWNREGHEGNGLPSRPRAEFNIEGNPLQGTLMGLVRECPPAQVTFVPDGDAQRTSDHGWPLDALPQSERDGLQRAIQQAQALGVRVSLFMDPLAPLMPLAKALGADRVELYTEGYAKAHGGSEQARVLEQYAKAAQAAVDAGLQVNAGHDLNLQNLADFVKACPQVQEVSIGHAFVADALERGYEGAVQAYLEALGRS